MKVQTGITSRYRILILRTNIEKNRVKSKYKGMGFCLREVEVLLRVRNCNNSHVDFVAICGFASGFKTHSSCGIIDAKSCFI
jgi:hypothetical protein